MKPNFKHGIKFSENLIRVEMGKTKKVMKKSVYLGEAILDLSKLVMYKYNYDYMIPKYSKKLQLCHVDTESFVHHIRTHVLLWKQDLIQVGI